MRLCFMQMNVIPLLIEYLCVILVRVICIAYFFRLINILFSLEYIFHFSWELKQGPRSKGHYNADPTK